MGIGFSPFKMKKKTMPGKCRCRIGMKSTYPLAGKKGRNRDENLNSDPSSIATQL
jgi:hypothetical protein